MLTSQGTLSNHYSLVFPAQLISDITKYERKSSGKFKGKRRKRSHDSQSGPKAKKRKRERGDSNEISESSSSESSVCETGHKTTEKCTPAANARVSSKRSLVQRTRWRTSVSSVTMNNSQRYRVPLPWYLQTRRVLILQYWSIQVRSQQKILVQAQPCSHAWSTQETLLSKLHDVEDLLLEGECVRLWRSLWGRVWRRKQFKCISWSKTLTDIIWQNGVQAESLEPLTLWVFVFFPLD